MSDQREFKGIWIPAEIWTDERLDALEKVIYAEIDSLSSYEKKCIKSNASLAEFCQCSESKVSRAIKKLINFGYVRQISFDGRHRTLQSCLGYLPRQDNQIAEADKADCLASNTMSNPKSNLKSIPENETQSNPKGTMKATEYAQKVMDLFTSICKDLPKPQKLTSQRKAAIGRALPDVTSFGGWEKFFQYIADNDYLTGKINGWCADFDWVLKPSNRIKIIEGRYNNKTANKQPERRKQAYEYYSTGDNPDAF